MKSMSPTQPQQEKEIQLSVLLKYMQIHEPRRLVENMVSYH